LFKGTVNAADKPAAQALERKFRAALGSRLDNLKLNVTRLATDAINVLIIHDEKSRRMSDMLEIYGMADRGDATGRETRSGSALLVNIGNDIVQYALKAEGDSANPIIKQLFDLALLSQGALNLDDVESFIQRSETLIENYIRQ
jgi:molecular chaperone HtpG